VCRYGKSVFVSRKSVFARGRVFLVLINHPGACQVALLFFFYFFFFGAAAEGLVFFDAPPAFAPPAFAPPFDAPPVHVCVCDVWLTVFVKSVAGGRERRACKTVWTSMSTHARAGTRTRTRTRRRRRRRRRTHTHTNTHTRQAPTHKHTHTHTYT
jgi:hypothetical protein